MHKLHAAVVAEMGHPDILFNNSGVTNKVIGPQGNIQDISAEEFENTWRTNTGTSYLVSQIFYGNEACAVDQERFVAHSEMSPSYARSEIWAYCFLL